MPATDDQVARTIERRLAIALDAPLERFSGELALYLEFLATQPELRSIIDAALAHEHASVVGRPTASAAIVQECAARMSRVAAQLASALRPWLRDSSLPEWVAALLQHFDEERALAAIEQHAMPWETLRRELRRADLCAGEVERLLDEADSATMRGLAVLAAEKRASAAGIAGTLARLWGHVRYSAPRALLPAWRETLDRAAEREWEQSSLALLEQALYAAPGSGNAALAAGLRHDLRRLTETVVDALETRPPVLPTLERFRRWCELYEREALLRKGRPGKKATETVRRRKRLTMSAEVLRYLYSQGFLPITIDMLEQGGELPEGPRPLLIEIRVVSDREALLRGYVACVQALRASERVRRLGLREAFLLTFLVEPNARFMEPAPLQLGGMLLRSVFVDLTAPSAHGRQPLGVEPIVERIAEEDRLFEFLNTASEAALDAVAGIGPAKIQQIIAGRPYGGAADMKRAGLPTAGVLYEALRAQALRGMQTLVAG